MASISAAEENIFLMIAMGEFASSSALMAALRLSTRLTTLRIFGTRFSSKEPSTTVSEISMIYLMKSPLSRLTTPSICSKVNLRVRGGNLFS